MILIRKARRVQAEAHQLKVLVMKRVKGKGLVIAKRTL